MDRLIGGNPQLQMSKGCRYSYSHDLVGQFIIGLVVPEMIDSIGWGTSFCVAAAVLSSLFVPRNIGEVIGADCRSAWGKHGGEERELSCQVAREVLMGPWGDLINKA